MCLIIYPPTINWNYMKQRPQQLMEQFGKHGHSVFYFDKHNAEGPVIEQASPNVYVIRHADYFLHHLFPQLSMGHKKMLWTSWSRKIAFAEQVQADYIVYDCVDDFPDWEEDEQAMSGKADIIFCTADHLLSKMQQLVPDKPIVSVPNGCDWGHFAPVALPTYYRTEQLYQLPPASGPKIGYIGAWAPWVDEEWIRYTAQQMPDAQIIIVGPELREDTGPLGENVFLLGYRDYEELPHILSYLDVCIIPFRLNRITQSTNPIKAYECLAAGKPVVSSNLPELQKLLPYVKISDTPETFVAAIKQSLDEMKRETAEQDVTKRSLFAKQFSWEQRYAVIDQALKQHVKDFGPIARLGGSTMLPAHASSAKVGIGSPSSLTEHTFVSTSYPLQHCTMNSYYAEQNLKGDPVLVGKLDAGEYQCLLQPPKVPFSGRVKRIYLEFDGHAELPKDAQLTISSTEKPWSVHRLTFANQPAKQQVQTYVLSDCRINETLSLDITDWFKGLLTQRKVRPSIHLSGSRGLMRLPNPRITVITKH